MFAVLHQILPFTPMAISNGGMSLRIVNVVIEYDLTMINSMNIQTYILPLIA